MTKVKLCKEPRCQSWAGFAKKGYCNYHYAIQLRRKPKKTIRAISVKQKLKMERDREVWMEIWNERPHICENAYCRKPLGSFLTSKGLPISHLFSHRRSKGAAPHLRYDKENIDLICPACHREYEFGDRERILIRPVIDNKKRHAISMLMGALCHARGITGRSDLRLQQHKTPV